MRASALSSAGRKNNMQPLDQQPRSTSTTEAISCICRTCIRSTPYLNKRAAHTLFTIAPSTSSALRNGSQLSLLRSGDRSAADRRSTCTNTRSVHGLLRWLGRPGRHPAGKKRPLPCAHSIRLIKGVYTNIKLAISPQ